MIASVIAWERALVGSLLLEPALADTIQIDRSMFRDGQLGELYELIRLKLAAKEPTNITAICADAQKIFIGQTAGELATLFTSITSQSLPNEVAYYAKNIRENYRLTKLCNLSENIALKTKDVKANSADLANEMKNGLSAIYDIEGEASAFTFEECCINLVEEMENENDENPVIETGLHRVDEAIGGFCAGELVVIAARPAVGKTILAMQIARHNSIAENKRCLVFSLEMTKSELTSRVVCGHAGVDSRKKRRNELNQSERRQIVEAVRELHGIPLSIIDKPGICIEEICAVARVDARRSPLDLVVVDYIGLVKPSDKSRQRTEQVAEITFALKNLAKELSVPVIALSQLNRQADDSPPKMSHLRESGAVEQDADIVLFLHPEQAMSNNITLICGKHRHGTAGSLELVRNGLKMLFDEKIRYTEFVG